MSLLPLAVAALLSAAQPNVPEPGLVSLIECPYWPLIFEGDASELRQEHREQLDQMISTVRQFGITDSAIIVLGAYSQASDQERWSRQRIRRVRPYLLRHGISRNRVRVARAPLEESDIFGGASEVPEVSYVVYQIFVSDEQQRRIFPPGSAVC